MSLFRRPGDSSSSSASSNDLTKEDEASALQQDSVLSRISSLDSAASGGSAEMPSPRLEMQQNTAQDVRDLVLHSLLEEKALMEAAEKLGKDRADPDVQKLGRDAYQEMARQISNNVDEKYASDEMRAHRAAAQEGITKLTRSNLNRLSVIPEGASQALVAQAQNILPSVGFDILSGSLAPTQLHLRGYPGLQTDRYVREFSEVEIVGKGGYGKVYKAKHKLDGSFYAVKRIPVSPAKLAKVQEHGSQELGSMLEEVRSLARFDHNNIVRYHNAWLEFTTVPMKAQVAPAPTLLRDDRLLEDTALLSSSPAGVGYLSTAFDDIGFDESPGRSHHGYSADIVFENSDVGIGDEEPKSETENLSLKEKLSSSKRKNRSGSQASQATIATISSTKSRMSVVEDADEDDDDEDIENIPRSHMTTSLEPSSEMSESMVSHSDVPSHLMPVRSSELGLMINVQMSLCETNLAVFLSSERHASTPQSIDQHCFHPCVSLELLDNIVAGVEYLHAQGVVHRDLKPANVFLSISTARHPPYGSVDLSSCKSCPRRDCLHVTPRIGDFGLVAALGDKYMGTSAKPVGTEFYRPRASSGISEKLDVYALGVVGFEMLQPFSTRMGRVAALTDLGHGHFPDGFASGSRDLGNKVQQLISDMVQPDEKQRLSCDEVKTEIGKLVHCLKD